MKSYLFAAVVAAFLFVAGASGQTTVPTTLPTEDAAFQTAKLVTSPHSSVETWTKYLATYPDAPRLRKVEAYRQLASRYQSLGRGADVCAAAQKWIELAGTDDSYVSGGYTYMGIGLRMQQKYPEAITYIQKAIDAVSSEVGGAPKGQMIDTLAAAGRVPEAVEKAKAYLEATTGEGDRNSIYTSYHRLYAGKDAAAAMAVIDLAAADQKLGTTRGLWQANKANAMAKAGDVPGALAYLEAAEPQVRQVTAYATLSTDRAKTYAQVARFVTARKPGSLSADEMALFRKLLPGNDAAMCMLTDAQGVATGYKLYLRSTNGRLNNEQITAFVKQLNSGDGEKLLVVTQQGKDLAAAIATTDAPLKAFLVPLFNGDYKTAAKVAFDRSKASTTDTEYAFWVQALSAVVRCNDQCYNKRAIDVIKWVNGDVAENPVADLLQ